MKKIIGLIIMLSILIGIGGYIWRAPVYQDATIELDGVWKVYKYNNQAIDQEYIMFEDGSLQYYREGVMEAEYEVEGNKLSIPSFNKEYQVQGVSENQMVLFEGENRTYLFRIKDMNEVVNKNEIINEWKVLFHDLTVPENETITFSEEKLIDKRNNEVYMELDYSWINDCSIYVHELDCEYEVYPLDENKMMLLEKNGYYVWELVCINE